MFDMLVKLYDLPETVPGLAALAEQGILVKRAMPHNKHRVVGYVREQFTESWASECEVCFARAPVSCFIAVAGDKVVGFGCYETTARNFFGPTGVSAEYRGRGIGGALLLKCLLAMRELGYGYAIIGAVGEAADFYRMTVGAVPIPESFPGVFRNAIGIEQALARQKQADEAGQQD